MAYNSNLPVDNAADIRENFRALKEDKIVDAATAVVAESADKLTNARKISLEGDATGSTSFDGSADVAIKVDVLSADVSATCTGNAATATTLETARNINGVAFDGSADITITAAANGGNADTVGGKSVTDIVNVCSPAGVVQYFAMANAPTGWLKADGSEVSRARYPDLFVAIGTMFGTGDGSTTFKLPDLRGEFVRGFDDGREVDSKRVFGSWQKPSLVNGDYNENKSVVTLGGLPQNRSVYGWEDSLLNGHVASEGSYWWAPSTVQAMNTVDMRLCGVTRPRNVALLACIKY